jgi:serine/threonine protein kinase
LIHFVICKIFHLIEVKMAIQDRVGQQLGNYRLTHLLGQGGFGDVYLGQHIYLNTQAAIKVLHEQMTAQDFQNFLKEAQTVAVLKHPHILRVLEFGLEKATPFLVMEYAARGTLRQCHPQGTIVPLPIVVSYVKQVASALQYAHDQKIIHRDVKPENMLVGDQGNIVLSDFGTAIVAHKTQSLNTHDAMGTVWYMAPEQIRGKARPASDQYALAVVVYEWLCGVCPFVGSAPIDIALQHLSESPEPLQTRAPGISKTVEQIVHKALAKDPRERFSSILEFADALEQACLPDRQVSLSQSPIKIQEDLSSGVTAPLILSQPIQSSQSAQAIVLVPVVGTQIAIYRGHTHFVETLTWSPDSSRIASGGWDQTVQVWDVTTKQPVVIYNNHASGKTAGEGIPEGMVFAVAWSPDGTSIASGSWDKTVQVWDATNGRQIYIHRGHVTSVPAVAWSPDSRRIASASVDGTVQVWDAATGMHAQTFRGHHSYVYAVTWSPDGTRIASGGNDRKVHIWDALTGQLLLTYENHASNVTAAAWSPNGSCIASGSSIYKGVIHVWDAVTGIQIQTYEGHSGNIKAVCWSPDSTQIASASTDGTVQVWYASTGTEIWTYNGHTDQVNAVQWAPDSSRIASAGRDTTVQVWRA